MQNLTLISLLILGFVLVGCSSPKAAYKSMQIQQQNHCQGLQGAHYEECMQPTKMHYEEYRYQTRDQPGD